MYPADICSIERGLGHALEKDIGPRVRKAVRASYIVAVERVADQLHMISGKNWLLVIDERLCTVLLVLPLRHSLVSVLLRR